MRNLFFWASICILLITTACSRKQYALFSYKKAPALATADKSQTNTWTGPVAQAPIANYMQSLPPVGEAIVSNGDGIALAKSKGRPSLKQLWQIKKDARILRRALKSGDTIEVKASVKKIAQTLQDPTAPVSRTGVTRSWTVAILLCLFLGGLGIHRFYLGYPVEGVLQLLTAGCCYVWALIDLIRILTKDLKPKNGMYEEDLY